MQHALIATHVIRQAPIKGKGLSHPSKQIASIHIQKAVHEANGQYPSNAMLSIKAIIVRNIITLCLHGIPYEGIPPFSILKRKTRR